MKSIVLGAGQVGCAIAKYLSQAQNYITIVDSNADNLNYISDKIDVQPIVGFASHPDVLKKAGIESCDLLIAVTSSDEVNITACEIANSIKKPPLAIARIRNQEYVQIIKNDINKKIAIDYMISPEIEVAKSIARNLEISGAFDSVCLAKNNLQMLGVFAKENSEILNTPLKLLGRQFPDLEIAIAIIKRNKEIIYPNAEDVLLLNDNIYLICKTSQIDEVMHIFGHRQIDEREITIIGGGNIGLHLAEHILSEHNNTNLKIIEKSDKRAEYISSILPKVSVINGDILDLDLLKQSDFKDCETAVVVTNDDKVNILSSLVSKKQGAKKVVSLLNNMHYASMLMSLGADCIISPKSLTIASILKYIRTENLSSIHPIADDNAVIIEAHARETSHIIGSKIEDIEIKNNLSVLCILRKETIYMIPKNFYISAQDDVILVCSKDSIEKVEKLFSIRPYYL